jgi:hypothetical protein
MLGVSSWFMSQLKIPGNVPERRLIWQNQNHTTRYDISASVTRWPYFTRA